VTDTGTGMSAEVAARAFDPFFTTKPIGQGTGQGLSMIYGFARQSNGHVTIDSTLEQGTSVKLYLPRHRGEIAAQHEQALKAAEHATTGETVLVVEDEPVVRGVIRRCSPNRATGRTRLSMGHRDCGFCAPRSGSICW